MGLLAHEDVCAHLMVDDEIPGAIRWATYHALPHRWDEEGLSFIVHLVGGSDREGEQELYLLAGNFEDYRALPPAWRFLDPRNGREIGRAAYPMAGPFANGSVLHANGVICAPWNRLAYADKRGPHADWTDPTQWQRIALDRTLAHTIPAMLARLRAEAAISPRRLAPLPLLDPAEAHG